MLRFLIAFAAVHAVVLGLALSDLASGAYFRYMDPAVSVTLLAFCVVLVPVVGAWAVLEGVALVRPRRVFDARHIARWPRFAFGLVAAVGGLALGTVLVAFLDEFVSDLLLLPAGSVIACTVTIACAPRIRRGRCIHCDYDLRRAHSGDRCPECGLTGAIAM